MTIDDYCALQGMETLLVRAESCRSGLLAACLCDQLDDLTTSHDDSLGLLVAPVEFVKCSIGRYVQSVGLRDILSYLRHLLPSHPRQQQYRTSWDEDLVLPQHEGSSLRALS